MRNSENFYLYGLPLNYSAANRARYEKKLRVLSRKMTHESQKEFKKLIDDLNNIDELTEDQKLIKKIEVAEKLKKKSDDLYFIYFALFMNNSKNLSSEMVSNSINASILSLNKTIKKITGKPIPKNEILSDGVKEVVRTEIDENASIIQTIPKKYFDRISKEINKLINVDYHVSTLTRRFDKINEQIQRYVRNISRNSTEKTYSSINYRAMIDLGIENFEWHYNYVGQQQRHQHVKWDGDIFNVHNLPISNETNSPVFPGWLPYCHCTALPVYKLKIGKK